MKIKFVIFPIVFSLVFSLICIGIMFYCLSFGLGTSSGGSNGVCHFLLPFVIIVNFITAPFISFLSLTPVWDIAISSFVFGLMVSSFFEWLYVRVIKQSQ